MGREDAIDLYYCILPHNALPGAVVNKVPLKEVDGPCGRGLAVHHTVKRGQIIFEEMPYLLSASGVDAMWQARWHAYLRLQEGARDDSEMRHALLAFDSLRCGEGEAERLKEVREAAEVVAQVDDDLGTHDMLKGDGAKRMIEEVLLRVKTNHFHFESGPHAASAMYREASLINHCCRPAVSLECSFSELRAGDYAERDGRLVATAVQDMQPGDMLAWNYGPAELLLWPLERRRKWLHEEFGFWCQCALCTAEQLQFVKLSESTHLSSMD